MKILVLNAGSSSLKYQLIDMDGEKMLCKGLVERIGIEGSNIHQKTFDGRIYDKAEPMKTHTDGIRYMLDALTDKEFGVVTNMDEIGAIGHRVLHGGDKFSASVLIDDDVIQAIKDNIPLGPLHNPANLMGIEACQAGMPGVPNVAVFDTAFHQTMPPKAFMYGVPYKYYEQLKVRRYGFHGTSHRYIANRAPEFLNRSKEGFRLISCHLGNGSSLCAIKDGKCIDTTMGIAPLEGLMMGTRCGSVDATVVQYLCNNTGMDVNKVLTMMNKESGLLGISEKYSDMRDIDKAADAGDEKAALAREMLVYGIQKYIGAYTAAMGGVDAIVFTAGIGENNIKLRARVMNGMEWLGCKLDPEKNNIQAEEAIISTDDSKVVVAVVPTNEEIMIARDTLDIVEGRECR